MFTSMCHTRAVDEFNALEQLSWDSQDGISLKSFLGFVVALQNFIHGRAKQLKYKALVYFVGTLVNKKSPVTEQYA